MSIIEKQNLNLAVVGHIDAGKSTLSGKLLHLLNEISTHTIEKNKKIAAEYGKATFELAYVLDTLEEQRRRGVTIAIAHKKFTTPNRNFTIVDCPGHDSYVKNCIVGIAQADSAIFVISAKNGVQAQSIEHAKLLFNNRVKNIIVAINKMDEVEWSKEIYDKDCSQVSKLLTQLQTVTEFKPDNIYYIPVSAITGVNILENKEIKWYTGETLVDILDSLPLPPSKDDKPFRLQINDVLSKPGVGVIVTGKVLCGKVFPGDKVIVKPGKTIGEVKTLEMHHTALSVARTNDNIGMVVRGLAKENVKKGFILAHPNSAPKAVVDLTCEMKMVHAKVRLKEGSDVSLHYGTGVVPARIKKILELRKQNKLYSREDIQKELASGNEDDLISLVRDTSAKVILVPEKTIVVETAEVSDELGRFSLRTELGTIAFAACESYTLHPDETNL